MSVQTRQNMTLMFTDPNQEDLSPALSIYYYGKHNVSVTLEAPWDGVSLCEELSAAGAVSLMEAYAKVFKAAAAQLKKMDK